MPINRDDNSVTVIAGVSELDEVTPVTIYVNPDSDGLGTHGVVVEVA